VFYALLKIYARLAIKIYLRRLIVNDPKVFQKKGPLLLAANHPNSFLDGIIITTLFDNPVHSLARGDVFKTKWLDRLLKSLQLLPVYRTSEGVENLNHNYATFAACQETFKKKESILIFSEGKCENEWHLRPLKKGTARLAITAWENGLPLEVIPTAFNYSSFKHFGKEVHLYFGKPLDQALIMHEETEGKKLLKFNELLKDELGKIVYEMDPSEQQKIQKTFSIRKGEIFYLLLLPALTGFILHAPLFFACKWFTEWKFKYSTHYDSALTSTLILLYPVYLIIFSIFLFTVNPVYSIVALVFLPFTAWSAVRVKYDLGM
jgi:1-acyl-sn-glycerol-3-phosphate acyltransferase